MRSAPPSLNSPVLATHLFTRIERFGTAYNHVADAFAKRKWLVELTYAQHHFIVAISTVEVTSAGKAFVVADQAAAIHLGDLRARRAIKYVGDLMGSRVVDDTPETRKALGVSGPAPNASHYTGWYAYNPLRAA